MTSGVMTGAATSVNQTVTYIILIRPSTGTRFSNTQKEMSIDASHVVHISLTEGLDPIGLLVLVY